MDTEETTPPPYTFLEFKRFSQYLSWSRRCWRDVRSQGYDAWEQDILIFAQVFFLNLGLARKNASGEGTPQGPFSTRATSITLCSIVVLAFVQFSLHSFQQVSQEPLPNCLIRVLFSGDGLLGCGHAAPDQHDGARPIIFTVQPIGYAGYPQPVQFHLPSVLSQN
jgi:hypothetical protein